MCMREMKWVITNFFLKKAYSSSERKEREDR